MLILFQTGIGLKKFSRTHYKMKELKHIDGLDLFRVNKKPYCYQERVAPPPPEPPLQEDGESTHFDSAG